MRKSFFSLAVITVTVFAAQITRAQVWQDITANVTKTLRGDPRVLDSDGARLYIVTQTNGIYVSSDNGTSFTAVNDVEGGVYGMTNKPGRFIRYVNGSVWVGWDPGSGALPGNGPINYGAATLHRLTPGETLWHKSSSGFPVGDTANQADDLAYDASTGTYYAASALGGAYISSDGSNWQQRATGLGGVDLPVTMVAFDGMAFEARGLEQVQRTTNQGTNWAALQSHQGFSTGLILEKNGRLMFMSNTPDRFNYSDDHGATWRFTTNGIKQLGDLTTKDGIIYGSGLIYGSGYEPFLGRPGLKFSATDGITWDNLPTNGLTVDTFGSLNMTRVLRQGNYLFGYYNSNGVVRLLRCDVSSFDFRPTTQFIQQPPSTNNYLVGDTLNLTAQAVGTNVTYQWRFNGTNINGATGTNFSFGPLQTNNSGTYSLVATGDRNSITNSSIVNVVERKDGIYDVIYHNPTTGGQTFVLPDGSMIAVTTISIWKFAPDGTLVTNRTVNGANFAVNFLDSSNRLIVTSAVDNGLNRIRRIKTTDLTDDATFDQTMTDRRIMAVSELPGRGYVIGGWFTYVTNSVSTNAINQICLVNYSGILDSGFPGGTGPGYTFPGTPQINMVMIVDTNIYISGSFNLWNGGAIPPTPPYRLFTNGTFNTNYTTVPANGAYFFRPYPGGKIFAVDGNSRPKVINADGTLDTSFNAANSAFNIAQNVASIAIGESNKIYVTGSMTSYAGTNVGKYLRLNSDGTFDSTFICTNSPSSGSGFTWVSYDPRGYIYLTRAGDTGTFQGQSFGYGPYRLFAGISGSAVPSGFDTWAAQFTFPPGKNNPGDDADGDGIPNVFEFYFGSNPTNGASAKVPTEITVNSGGQNYPALTFIRSKTASGVTLIPQASTSLTFGSLIPTTVESVVDLGNGTEQVTIRSTTTIAAQPYQFLRILLSVP
jgi:hypothetical protein